jgi:hypothetical protein
MRMSKQRKPRKYRELVKARKEADEPISITSEEWTRLANGWLKDDEQHQEAVNEA